MPDVLTTYAGVQPDKIAVIDDRDLVGLGLGIRGEQVGHDRNA